MDIQKSRWRLSYWNLLIELFHNRLKKAKVMMFCSLGEKMDNINTESHSYRETDKCQEKSTSRDLVIIEHLGLRNETILTHFLGIEQRLRERVTCIKSASHIR